MPDTLGAPSVETEVATEIRRTTVILNGTVNPEGSNVSECYFLYGETPSFGHRIQCANSPGSGSFGIPVYAQLEGLSEATTYYVKLVAKNGVGEGFGHQEKFTTLPTAPSASTQPAGAVGRKSAKLNGLVDPGGAEVSECVFEYGTTRTYGKTIECRSLPGSGETAVPVSAEPEGLKESQTYHYRLVATNAYGTHYGEDLEFTTLPTGPEVKTEPASEESHTSAKFTGIVNPNGFAITECYFEYSVTRSYGENPPVPCTTLPPAGEEPVEVSAVATGLAEHQHYYYQLVAANEFTNEPVLGGNEPFNTLPAAPRAVTRSAADIGPSSATLKGSVNPRGATVTVCEFEYGSTPTFGKVAKCSESPGGGENPAAVTAAVTELRAATTYYFRLRAKNEWGNSYGNVNKFITEPEGALPAVTKVSPSKDTPNGGQVVTIKGENFSGATAVYFGSVAATEVHEVSVKEVTAVAPPNSTGPVDVTVVTPYGTSAVNSKDKFTYSAPKVTKVEPASGSKTGGTVVTIDGYGFATGAGATSVLFGSQSGTDVSCTSSTQCTVTAPAATKEGPVAVIVEVAGKGSKKKEGSFTYTA